MAGGNARHFCVVVSVERQDSNSKAALLSAAAWMPGDVIRVKFLEGDPGLRSRVRAVAERWTGPDMANLSLQFVEDGDAEIRIAFQQGDGSWSFLGAECRDVPDGEPTMNYGWLTADSDDDEIQRVVLHEFGHALGLVHEHQNPPGGIDWNEPSVIADLSGPPYNWDEATIHHNALDHYRPDEVMGTDVDSLSIMMFPIPAVWTNDGYSAELNPELSDLDIELIRQVYS